VNAEMQLLALRKYLNERNHWRSLMKQPDLKIAFMTEAEAREVAQMIEGDLSPENLCCDGELSERDTQYRFEYLKRVQSDLKCLAVQNKWHRLQVGQTAQT
jgi:hypothetical protein